MKHQKDIFDIFREHQHKLDERPSKRAWQRLERRLDNDHRSATKNIYKQLSMIAALLAFLAIVSVVVSLPSFGAQDQAMVEEFEAIPLADLGESNDHTASYEVVVFTKHLHDRLANPIPIAEGQASKKLVPATLVANSDSLIAKISNHLNVRPYKNKKLKDSITLASQPVQSLFSWLIGEWQSENENQVSVEKWAARDSQTLEGKGYLLRNGDTTFAEKMSITNVGKEVYLSTALDSGAQQVQFKLKNVGTKSAIFENKSIDFPQQVILQQNTATNFSTIYTNSKPAEMPESQVGFIQNRNAVINQQAIRNMDRVRIEK